MALCRRISYLYALALLTVYALFLPLGGYERMMEGKYRAFLLLSLGYVLAMTALGAWKAVRWREPMCLAALAYLALTALSAALSPYGTAVLLGGTRRDGLLTAALYAAVFLLLARHLRPDRRLLYAAAASAALCGLLVLVQLTGRNPLWLYPAGLNYFDGDVAYSGFYAGAAGNIDFTAFLLALCAAAMAAALVRGWSKWLLAPLALTVWTLWQLRVAAALVSGLTYGHPELKIRGVPSAEGLIRTAFAGNFPEKAAAVFDGRRSELLVYGMVLKDGSYQPDGFTAVLQKPEELAGLLAGRSAAALEKDRTAIAKFAPELVDGIRFTPSINAEELIFNDPQNFSASPTDLIYLRAAVFVEARIPRKIC